MLIVLWVRALFGSQQETFLLQVSDQHSDLCSKDDRDTAKGKDTLLQSNIKVIKVISVLFCIKSKSCSCSFGVKTESSAKRSRCLEILSIWISHCMCVCV